MDSPPLGRGSDTAPLRSVGRGLLRSFPPARLLWLMLLGLGIYGANFLGGLGYDSLLLAAVVAVVVDLGFQSVRFARPRAPDAALATGLFVSLIFPPTANPVLIAVVVFAAVALRHILRLRGHPWLNPAATGVVLGTVFLGLAPAWWVGIGPYGEVAIVSLGLALLARSRHQWALPATFLGTYGPLAAVQHLLVGSTLDPHILLLQAIDPATLFFALFMVTEPRTAPSARHEQVLYAGVAGASASFLPLFLPSLGILVALLTANTLSLYLRWRHVSPTSSRSSRSLAAGRRGRSPAKGMQRWPVSYRAAAGFLTLVVVIAVVASNPISPSAVPLVQSPTSPIGGGGGGGGGLTNCLQDNPSIPASTLSQLHKLLGPSVILSYDSSTGIVVFYDPVNHVTVTESDLYEDFGYADFNGDDYAVSGCVP